MLEFFSVFSCGRRMKHDLCSIDNVVEEPKLIKKVESKNFIGTTGFVFCF